MGKDLFLVQRVQFATHIKYEGERIRSKGRMDANNSWCVSELLAADCEKALLHAGLEDTMQKWYEWPGEMKKKR